MTAFDLLSEPIKRYIWDKRWEELRSIQTAAIENITANNSNYILASRTASGKTEAAFLPILSKLDFKEKGVQVLYISPLIALINDQFHRVEELCKYLDISITKWHGEANRTTKEAVLKQPNGIILITPESIEAMFVNKPFNIQHLFSNLKYVVIDEIHSFIGTARGIQLKSLLARIKIATKSPFSVIGLSATIGSYVEAQKFTGNAGNTTVLLDSAKKETRVTFKYFQGPPTELPLSLLKDLYLETRERKVLIFPNSRGTAEEVAVKLKKISDRVKGHANYFSHHSSVDKEVREYVEYFAKNNDRKNFCIACTSTLELGIDIGSVDEVVQIDAAHSIASLIQRIGRSGRKDGQTSNLFLYATNRWSLLQSIACWELYQTEYIEPPEVNPRPYDILVHQILSILKGSNGISLTILQQQLALNFAFTEITAAETTEIINHLITKELIEKIGGELIIGVKGERIVNDKDFYSVFLTESNLKVLHAGNKIGEIPFSPQIKEDANILLAAKIWKIKFIDFKAKKIEVEKAHDGKKPLFFGSYPYIDKKIREKMLELLFTQQLFPYLSEDCEQQLKEDRQEFSAFKIKDLLTERPLQVKHMELELFTFTSTKVNHVFELLFMMNDIPYKSNTFSSSFEIYLSAVEFKKEWSLFEQSLQGIDQYLETFIVEQPIFLDFSKWGLHLPVKFQVSVLKAQYYDFETAKEFLNTIRLVEN